MNKLVLVTLICLVPVLSHASEVMPWITPTGIDGLELETYYGWSSRGIDFFIDEVSIPFDYISNPFMVKLSFRPELGFSPYAKIGALSSEIQQTVYDNDSNEQKKKWYGGFDGFAMGAGVNYVLGGDSVVYGQFLLDIGLTYYYSALNVYKNYDNAAENISNSLSIWEVHGSLIVNKAFKMPGNLYLTPYAGVNMIVDYGRWNSYDEGISMNGSKSSLHVITGFEISFKSVSAKVELSLFDGFGIAAGLNFDFGY